MSSTLVDVRTAVSAALNYLEQFADLLLEPDTAIKGLRLEETELSEDKLYWLITLGFDRPIDPHNSSLSSALNNISGSYTRVYRIFKVDAQTGEVQSI
jgi:hypothetical protein